MADRELGEQERADEEIYDRPPQEAQTEQEANK